MKFKVNDKVIIINMKNCPSSFQHYKKYTGRIHIVRADGYKVIIAGHEIFCFENDLKLAVEYDCEVL